MNPSHCSGWPLLLLLLVVVTTTRQSISQSAASVKRKYQTCLMLENSPCGSRFLTRASTRDAAPRIRAFLLQCVLGLVSKKIVQANIFSPNTCRHYRHYIISKHVYLYCYINSDAPMAVLTLSDNDERSEVSSSAVDQDDADEDDAQKLLELAGRRSNQWCSGAIMALNAIMVRKIHAITPLWLHLL